MFDKMVRQRMFPHTSGSGGFHTTQWSKVLAAGGSSSPDARQALSTICETYWLPLYVYVRRRGDNRDDAEDFVQGFFAHLLNNQDIRLADPKRGRFRSFLLTCLKHYIANQRDKQRAQKRGGGQAVFSLDFDRAETRYTLEPGHNQTPEKIFDRHWALTVLEQATDLLCQEMSDRGKADQFKILSPYLTESQARGGYTDAAEALDMSPGATRVAVHRMRQRYRELIRQLVAGTVAEQAEIDDEIRSLMTALAG